MADKIVQLVDKNSNNLYPVAGAVIDNAVSTGAISSQAVTNAKIENGAVNGVANDATAIGTAKLALDTVGTPNLRDASVTSDKIDWPTLGFQTGILPLVENAQVAAPWAERNIGTAIDFTVQQGATYLIFGIAGRIESKATSNMSLGIRATSGSATADNTQYCAPNTSVGRTYVCSITTESANLSVKRIGYTSTTGNVDFGGMKIFIARVG